MASHGLQLPPILADCFTEEGWALMSEDERLEMIETVNQKDVITDEGRRIHNEIIVGDGTPDFDLTRGSPGRNWRIFTDPTAALELLDIANEYHWESERKQREALLSKQSSHDAERDGCSSVDNEDESNARRQWLIPEIDLSSAVGNERKAAQLDPLPDIELRGVGSNFSKNVQDSDSLLWLRNYHVHQPSKTLLGPMRYTSCQLGDICSHYPTPMLQIFDALVKCYGHGPYFKTIRDKTHVEVYGMLAVRDCLDYSRNYIFHRSRENAQDIDVNGGYLRLRSPARGISAMNCLIELDIRIKADNVQDDCKIIDGCVRAIGQFDPWSLNHVDSINGRITFASCVVSRGVEATISLDFLEVPAGGFYVQMCGSTTLHKGLYSFIDERCRDHDGFVSKTGKYRQNFVAAVRIGDTLCLDFMEKGRDAPSFAASKHGNQQQLYRFNNGGLVSVQVSWSTLGTVGAAD